MTPRHAVITTPAGLCVMLDRETGEVMHPGVGPIVEAERLYVGPSRLRERLMAPEPAPFVLLDVGLGAGSNAVAAWRAAEAVAERRRTLEICSLERTLGALELALQPEHAQAFGFSAHAAQAARALLETRQHTAAHARWRLRVGDFEEQLAGEPDASVDCVFWDPFSPRVDPERWSARVFRALRRVCRSDATLHTYSGATSTRTALLLAGFSVGYGPPASDKQKRSTIAALDAAALEHPLDRRWLESLSRAPAAWPRDAPEDAWARIARLPQFQGR